MTDKLLETLLSEAQGVRTYEAEDPVLMPLLDEIGFIEDEHIKEFVRSILFSAPECFWTAASHNVPGENPPDEYIRTGNMTHTKRVVRVVYQLGIAQDCDEYELDMLVAAALLHDLAKVHEEADGEQIFNEYSAYGVDAMVEKVREYDNQHAADGCSSTMWLDDDVATVILRLVRCHQGVWSPIPETIPTTKLEWIMNFGEIIASKLHVMVDGEKVDESRWRRKG